MKIHIAPLPTEFLRRVRERGLDDQGQAVRRLVAEGGERVRACRDVLRRARPGEPVLLASFCPATLNTVVRDSPYKEFGPIFVLAEPSEELVARDVLPLPSGRSEDYFGPHFTVQAYSHDQDIVDGAFVAAGEAAATAERFLAAPDVDYVQARLLTLGCFGCRIDRVL